MKVALGITTLNRPEYLEKCLKSIDRHLDVPVFVYNDGSATKHRAAYRRAYNRLQSATVLDSTVNEGVTVAKNVLFRTILDTTDADWVFIAEDDVIVKSPDVLAGYIDACKNSGFQHLGFGPHPQWNPEVVSAGMWITLYQNLVAGFSIYSRKCLETVGLMDEKFDKNCLEHVEHTMRLAQAGYAFKPIAGCRMADATGSDKWLSLIPGSVKKSVISNDADHQWRFTLTREMWRERDPETFAMVWPA